MRGALTIGIVEKAKEFLGREITVRELRLYPYLDYTMKNSQKLEPCRINQEEREILQKLREAGHIEGGASGLGMTKEFYDFIQEILWMSYVVDAHDDYI